MATYLVPHLGYDKAASIAAMAHETGKSVIEVVLEEKILPEDRVKEIFSGTF